jgi:hypothetical protein
MKPNPFLVASQPQAKVRGHIVRSARLSQSATSLPDNDLFSFVLDRIDRADLVTEGAVYDGEEPRRFFGSAIFTLRRLSDAGVPGQPSTIQLLEDSRLVRILEARVYREILRHLGDQSPANFDWSGRESLESGEHRVYMDFECVLMSGLKPDALGGL